MQDNLSIFIKILKYGYIVFLTDHSESRVDINKYLKKVIGLVRGYPQLTCMLFLSFGPRFNVIYNRSKCYFMKDRLEKAN